jgi:hypothetical protein
MLEEKKATPAPVELLPDRHDIPPRLAALLPDESEETPTEGLSAAQIGAVLGVSVVIVSMIWCHHSAPRPAAQEAGAYRASSSSAGQAGSPSSATLRAEEGTVVHVTDTSPYYEKLAALDQRTRDVPREIVEEFRRHTALLERVCPDPPDRIGDYLLAGQREFAKKGKVVRLLQITVDVAAMLREGEDGGVWPRTKSCSEAVGLWVVANL